MTDPYTTAGHIRAALAAIRDNYDAALYGTAPRDESDAHPRRAQAPPPVSPHILDVRREAHHDLAYFALFILEQVNQGTITTRVDAHDIDALCRFIDTWALALAEQHPDDADQCRRDMAHHAGALRRIVAGEYTSRMVIADHCPNIVWAGELMVRCTGTLIAYVQHGDAPLPPGVRCTTHPEHEWAPHEWPALGRRISA
jgi:hypothetical protein